jgi:hypothetical protein
MSKDLSPEEVKNRYEKVFPGETGKLFHHIWNDVANLHLNWQNYRTLYGTSPETIELINKIATSFFKKNERIMRNDVVMRIARLTDPPETGKGKNEKENARFEKLAIDLQPFITETFFNEIKDEIKDLQDLSKKIHDIRNKILVHSDLYNVIEKENFPVDGVSRAEIEQILEKIRNVTNKIETYFKVPTTYFQKVISSNDAKSLVVALKQVQEYRSIKRRENS